MRMCLCISWNCISHLFAFPFTNTEKTADTYRPDKYDFILQLLVLTSDIYIRPAQVI